MKKTKEKKQELIDNKHKKADLFERPKANILMIGLIIIVLSVLFFEIGYLNYAPRAHDTEQWRWASQELIDYNQNNSDNALWTDNMFSGMPSYLLFFPAKFPFFQNIPHMLNDLISWRLTFMIFGAIGMYLLLIYLKFSPLIALFSALAFALSPHFIGLLEIGHNTKFRTIMYLPWILLTFEDLRSRKRLLSLGLFSIFLIDQLRVNHFQISYYTFIMLFIYWFTYLLNSIKEKKLSDFYKFTMLAIAGLAITALAVSNPYLSTYEYSHYTIRGGSGGLSTDYATGWSFGIGETLSLFVPHFFGGISPYYWGPMPFTQTFHYMGILVIYLAIMASIFYFKETKIKALIIISIVALLISFGKHLPFLSNFLLGYLPLFNKFRVPAMILVLLQFAIPVLAAFGLKLFIEKIKVKDPAFTRALYISMIVVAGLLVLFFRGDNLFSGISFSNPEHSQEMRLTVSQISHLRSQRYDLLIESGKWSMGILLAGILLLFMLVKGFLKKNIVLLLLIGLMVFDLIRINENHLQNDVLVPESTVLKDFQLRETDLFLLEDEDLFRIYPFHDFHSARWSYFHQSIGGYHGAKLSRYQDILDDCLYYELISGLPINWNIMNMLNVKYLIFSSIVGLPNNDIEFVFLDGETRHAVYKNNAVFPRAWFVRDHELITDKNRMIIRLNDPSFDPKYTVLVENEIPEFSFDEDATIEMIQRDKHHTKWTTNSEEDSFMVISEVYFPAGWNMYINGKKTEIYPVNHFLRGVIVPAGTNIVEMNFEPTSYKVSVILSAIGLLLAIGFTICGIVDYFKSNYGKGVVYKIV